MDSMQRNIENRFYCSRDALEREGEEKGEIKDAQRCTRDGRLTSLVWFHVSATSGDVPTTFCGAPSQDFAFVLLPRQSGSPLGIEEEARGVVNVDDFTGRKVLGVDIDEWKVGRED